MENNKTLTSLYSTGRNRLAKVVYMFLYGFVSICAAVIIFTESNVTFRDSLTTVVIIVVIFEFIKRAFYYVALGTVRPTE